MIVSICDTSYCLCVVLSMLCVLHEYFLLNKNAADIKLGNPKTSPKISISREKMILSAIGEDGYLLYSPAKISSMYISLLYDSPIREISSDGAGQIISNPIINENDRNIIKDSMTQAVISGTMKNIRSSANVKIIIRITAHRSL